MNQTELRTLDSETFISESGIISSNSKNTLHDC